MSPRTKIVAMVVTILVLFALVFLAWRIIGPDPRFESSRLVGRTYPSVVAEFGKPYHDSRTEGSYQSDGSFGVSYTGLVGQTYVLFIKDDHVIRVQYQRK
jgi:hypothetical protein